MSTSHTPSKLNSVPPIGLNHQVEQAGHRMYRFTVLARRAHEVEFRYDSRYRLEQVGEKDD